jgi:hypothetical protein
MAWLTEDELAALEKMAIIEVLLPAPKYKRVSFKDLLRHYRELKEKYGGFSEEKSI